MNNVMGLWIKADVKEPMVSCRLVTSGVDSRQLEQLQLMVDGNLRQLRLGPDHHLFLDEDGKFVGKPLNMRATVLCHKVINVGLDSDDVIVGNIVVFGNGPSGGEASIDEAFREKIMEQIQKLMREMEVESATK